MTGRPRRRGRLGLERELAQAPVRPVQRFIRVSEIAGLPLLLAGIAALVWCNLDPRHYAELWETHVALDLGALHLELSLRHLVNDCLLPGLFFVAGMEVKRELLRGDLSDWQRASFPVITAVGGMILPALIYLAINFGGEHTSGWGVPVATDIAFVLMVFALLGERVPRELKVLILAFALVDDIGGVLVIAFAYSSNLDLVALAVSLGAWGAMLVLLRVGIRETAIHVPLGLVCFGAMMASGVHTTIGGILLGALVPARPQVSQRTFRERGQDLLAEHEDLSARAEAGDTDEIELLEEREASLGKLELLVRGTETSVTRLTRLLNPWVSYFVLPLFALANSGVELAPELLGRAAEHRASIGVLVGLCVGKPLGFLAAAWLATRTGLATRPEALTWPMLFGAALITGIGFTVSLFIAAEAFEGDAVEVVKVGILAASVLAGVAGYFVLRWATPREST